MIAQSRPNVKYFLESFTAIKSAQNSVQAQNWQFITAFPKSIPHAFNLPWGGCFTHRSFIANANLPAQLLFPYIPTTQNITSAKYCLLILTIAAKLVVLLTNQKDYEHRALKLIWVWRLPSGPWAGFASGLESLFPTVVHCVFFRGRTAFLN